jgi:CelD/BcsL family acetyltransferase involved in cellulose biosynthesis
MTSALTFGVDACLLSGFNDPAVSPCKWSELLQAGDTDAVNLTWHWQREWWETFGSGRLLLIAVYRRGRLMAVAPLFADQGMVFNICPEDHLDFVGDVSDPVVLDAILDTARSCVDRFQGFRFYFIPDQSHTGAYLSQAAQRLGFECHCEERLPSPWLDIENQADTAEQCTRKKSLVRHERFFRRQGELEFETLTEAEDVFPHLEDFFEQHISRRSETSHPSLFLQPAQREYYRRLTKLAAAQGWLRFARLTWNGRPIAYHFGLRYQDRYLWAIPTFDIELASHSPGEVLLRQVLLQAIEEGARQFDFGPGDEAYKHRFATHVTQLATWGLYPRSSEGTR